MSTNQLLDLLKKAREDCFWDSANAIVDEAIALVETGRIVDAYGGVFHDELRIPLPPPEPVVTERHRKLAKAALDATRSITGRGVVISTYAVEQVTKAAKGIAKAEREMDDAER